MDDGLRHIEHRLAFVERGHRHHHLPGRNDLTDIRPRLRHHAILPREHVLCLADDETDLLTQLAAVMAVGSTAVVPENELSKPLYKRLPKDVQARIQVVSDWSKDEVLIDAVLHHGDSDQLRAICEQVAQRSGAIVGVHGLSKGETGIALERLVIERALSVNTAAAGGNASLMTIG